MLFRVLADFVMMLHFGFVLFAVLGGFLALKWKRLAWIHVPAFLWAGFIEFAGWICPLTYLETWLLEQSGARGYQEGFVEHYLFPLLYPGELTRTVQFASGVLVLSINLLIYGWLLLRSGRKKAKNNGLRIRY